MDPVSSTANAVAAFFNYLSTTQGQASVAEFLKLDAAFNTKLLDLFQILHSKFTGK